MASPEAAAILRELQQSRDNGVRFFSPIARALGGVSSLTSRLPVSYTHLTLPTILLV